MLLSFLHLLSQETGPEQKPLNSASSAYSATSAIQTVIQIHYLRLGCDRINLLTFILFSPKLINKPISSRYAFK